MKKGLLIIPFVLLACKKESASSEIKTVDSVVAESVPEQKNQRTDSDAARSQQEKDSIINNAPATKEVLRTGVMRKEDKEEIVRTAEASMLPINVGEEIKEDGQRFILKISGYEKPNIKASIKAESGMNIRFNQVKYADGTYDGPFGQTLNIPSKGKGEIWLIIGKSNMASGQSRGSFSVQVE